LIFTLLDAINIRDMKFYRFRNIRKAQIAVEYLLMLSMIVGMFLMFAVMFYKKILGVFFTIIGMIMGAGTPQQ